MQDYGNLALRRVGGQNPEHSMTVDSEESRSPYGVLTLNGESCSFTCSILLRALMLDPIVSIWNLQPEL